MSSGRELIDQIVESFSRSEIPRYEARLIAEHVTGAPYAELLTGHFDLTQRQSDRLDSILDQRNAGTPLAYILRSGHFRGLDLYVDERVLIPRSETEVVVQHAIDYLSLLGDDLTVVDMCTGSGAIAFAIAHECAHATVYASDISSDALDVARLNAAAVGSTARRVHFVQGDLYGALPGDLRHHVHLIISNPPYIGEDESGDLDESVIDHEPHGALFGGVQGQDFYPRILSGAREWLCEGGRIVCEISPRHRQYVIDLARDFGFTCEVYEDLTGRDRVAVFA